MYIKSVLTHANPAWRPLISKTSCRNIEAVQNISVRTIIALPFYVTNETILNSVKFSSIREFTLKNAKSLFYKKQFPHYTYIRNLGSSTEPQLLKKKTKSNS